MGDGKLIKKGAVIIEGHIQGLSNTRLLGRVGIPVYVIDKGSCVARYSKYCNKFFRCPDYLSEDFADYLINLHRSEGLQDWLLLPSNDHAVYTISKHKETLKQYFKVITEDIDVIDKIYNKRNLLGIAREAGIPIPATFFPERSNPPTVDLRYPILIKGNQGLSFYKRYKNKALLLKTPTELINIWDDELKDAQPGEYFIQEVIPDKYKTVSLTVFAEKGTILTYWMGVKLRQHPITFGTATCCKSILDKGLLDLSIKLIEELGYTGVCEIEWLRDPRDDESKLIEINPRTWLWVGLAAACGVNFPLEIYDWMFHDQQPASGGYTLGKYWINLYTDIVFGSLGVIKGQVKLKDLWESYRSFSEACFDRMDLMPFFAYGFNTCKYLKQR